MSTTALTVVVAAVPSLVDALRATGQFASVLPVGSTGGLKALLESGTLSVGTNDKVFIFADCTPVDTDLTLPFLVQRLVAMGTPVIILGTSPAGRDLVAQCPGAGLLEGPLRVNQLLGALSGHAGLPTLSPDPVNPPIALPGMPAPAAAPSPVASPFSAPAPAPVVPAAPQPVAAPSPFGAGTPASPFGAGAAPVIVTEKPVTPSEPARTAPAAADGEGVALPVPAGFGAAAPSFGQGGASPFGAGSAPGAAPSPFTGGAAAPGAAPSPFGAATAPVAEPATPFGASSTPAQAAPAAFGTAAPAASPFGAAPTPAAEPVPAVEAPAVAASAPAPSPFGAAASPFGAPKQTAEPASPFSGSSAVETVSPFGASGPGGAGASPFGAAAPQAGFGAQGPAGSTQPFGGQAGGPFGPGAGADAFGGQGGYGAPAGAPMAGGGPFGGVAQRVGAPVMERQPRRGFVFTITCPKGGTGKSSMSLNLAAYLGLRLRGTGRNVVLIDANVQQADLGKYLNAWTPTVEGLLKDPSAIHPDRIDDFLVHKPEYNLSVLLGPSTPEAANPLYFDGKKYSQILDALRQNYDYIIIDTPVAELYHTMFRDFALPRADFIGVVITPNVTTLMNTDAWLSEVTSPVNAGGNGVDPQKVGIVLNRAEDDIGIDEDEVRRELSRWRFLASVPETKEWKRCNNQGQLVAPRNYHELNEAFAAVLQAATGEDLITAGSGLPATAGKSKRWRFGRKK